jgi:hypothetical protein
MEPELLVEVDDEHVPLAIEGHALILQFFSDGV